MRNLHVVFTMNPSANGLRDRASTSPALFNRCVLDWLGDWTFDAYYHVASELTHTVNMQKSDVNLPDFFYSQSFLLLDFSTLLRRHYLVYRLVYPSNQHIVMWLAMLLFSFINHCIN